MWQRAAPRRFILQPPFLTPLLYPSISSSLPVLQHKHIHAHTWSHTRSHMLITRNLINEEAETPPVGTLLDLTAYSTAEPHVMLAVIHLNIWTPSASFISKRFCILFSRFTITGQEDIQKSFRVHLRPAPLRIVTGTLTSGCVRNGLLVLVKLCANQPKFHCQRTL